MTHQINHIGILVDDLEAALHLWRDVLGLPLGHSEHNAAEGVDIHFLSAGGAQIELIAPIEAESGLGKYLAKRGPGMHHLCLEVADIESSMAHLQAAGIELINETPRSRPEGTRYCFVHPKSAGGVMIELYEQAKE